MSTTTQLLDEIRRLNAQKSTGPVTRTGKQRSAMNAVKHNLSVQHLVLLESEVAAYDRLARTMFQDLNPKSEPERQTVQKIIDINFRLNRIVAIENNMLSFGVARNESDAIHDDRIEVMGAQCRAWIERDSVFNNIGRYEARLTRQLHQHYAELRLMKAERKAQEEADKLRTAEEIKQDKFNPASFGDALEDQPESPDNWRILDQMPPPDEPQNTENDQNPMAA